MIRLYSYWRSSAAYRVRLGLHLKDIPFEYVAVDLAGGEALADPAYLALNPQALVPVLVVDGAPIAQSLAILEYLDERHPAPPLLGTDPLRRARSRQIALSIGADLHPLNNPRVLRYVAGAFHASAAERQAWHHHWLRLGLDAAERLADPDGPYAVGADISLADLFIVPQLYNARRFEFPLEPFPRLRRIDAACASIEAFARALPERQPDAPFAGA